MTSALFGSEPPGEVGADRLPVVAAVVALEELASGEIEPLGVVRRHDEGRVPVPAHRVSLPGAGADRRALPGLPVEADDRAVLRHGVDGVRVGRVDARLHAVRAADAAPVAGANAGLVASAGRAAHRAVVLRAAVDVVERGGVVHGDAIELRARERVEVPPGLAAVVRFVEPAVVARDQVQGVGRVEGECVVIDVVARFSARTSCRRRSSPER